MRLIDADKVIEHLENIKKDNPNFIDMTHTIGFMSMINQQPTAYDVDEVIKRLKKLRDCKYLTGITNNAYEFGACNALNDAIKIIKAGGKNDNW